MKKTLTLFTALCLFTSFVQAQISFTEATGMPFDEVAFDDISVQGVTGGCANPTVPSVSFAPSIICDGNSALLSISGDLNDAENWVIYTGSCSGTPLGVTTGTTYIVTPTAPSTTYYVRGEGGCVSAGSCGSVTIQIAADEDASFSYTAAAYCLDASDPTPTITGTAGGSFSADNNGLSFNPSTGAIDVSASVPGTYTVTYTTGGACPNSSNVSLTINGLTVATSSTEDDGTGNGTATATASAGSGTYTYLWSSGVTTATATDLAAGSYDVTVTDIQTGCTTTETVVVNSSAISDDDCAGANDINSLFGGAVNVAQTSSLQDNTGYTTVGDPTTGFDCHFNGDPLESTIWYTFTGDGNTYRIRSVECNATTYLSDAQVAIYSGADCNNLTAVACNDDEDGATGVLNVQVDIETTQGTEYYMLIDGYDGNAGEFCLEVTQIDPSGILDVAYTAIALYPNPTEGMVSWNGISAQTVELYDNAGRVAFTATQPNGSVDISSLTEGIYIMMLHTEEGVYTSRVVKQ